MLHAISLFLLFCGPFKKMRKQPIHYFSIVCPYFNFPNLEEWSCTGVGGGGVVVNALSKEWAAINLVSKIEQICILINHKTNF